MKEQSVTAFDVSNDSRQDKSCHCNSIYILSTHPLICTTHVVLCILNVQNAYESVLLISSSFPPMRRNFFNNKECHYQVSLVTILFHKQRIITKAKKVFVTKSVKNVVLTSTYYTRMVMIFWVTKMCIQLSTLMMI